MDDSEDDVLNAFMNAIAYPPLREHKSSKLHLVCTCGRHKRKLFPAFLDGYNKCTVCGGYISDEMLVDGY